MGNKFYALQIDSVEGDIENIELAIREGNPVIIVDEIQDLENIGIFEEVEIVS